MKSYHAVVVGCSLLAASLLAGTASAGMVFNDSTQLNMHGTLAAVNFYFSDTTNSTQPLGATQVTGTIQGVSFVNDDLTLTTGPSLTIGLPGGGTLTTTLPYTTPDQARAVEHVGGFSGPDAVQAQNLATAITYLANGQTGSLDFAFGAGAANKVVDVAITGGDDGWANGILTATGGGGTDSFTGVGDKTTAEILSFVATTDGSGNLNIALGASVDYIGLSGIVVSTPTPEPSSLVLGLLALAGLLVVKRRMRR